MFAYIFIYLNICLKVMANTGLTLKGLPKKHIPFGASATRIDLRSKAKTDFRPGPGTYAVDPNLPPPQASRTMGVLPVPPVVKFPTEITGTEARCTPMP